MGTNRESNSFPASKQDWETNMNGSSSDPHEKHRLEQVSRQQYAVLLQQVSERVWQLWMADLRHDQERQGQRRKER